MSWMLASVAAALAGLILSIVMLPGLGELSDREESLLLGGEASEAPEEDPDERFG